MSLAVFAHQNIDLQQRTEPILAYQLPPRDFVSDEVFTLPLATIFVSQQKAPGRHSFWGNDAVNPGGVPLLVGASENIAEIRLLKDGKIVQQFHTFFAVLSDRQGGLGRVFILPENRNVFASEHEEGG